MRYDSALIGWKQALRTRSREGYVYTNSHMSTTTKPFVLIVGGAGQTGHVITKALLKDGKFVRPSTSLIESDVR